MMLRCYYKTSPGEYGTYYLTVHCGFECFVGFSYRYKYVNKIYMDVKGGIVTTCLQTPKALLRHFGALRFRV